MIWIHKGRHQGIEKFLHRGMHTSLNSGTAGLERLVSKYQTIHGSWVEGWKHILKESEIITKDGGVAILPTQCIYFFDRIEQITSNE